MNHESIDRSEYHNINICDKCGALIYWYQNKKGKIFPVNVLSDFSVLRRGNHNNMVDYHDCTEHNKHQLYVQMHDDITLPVELKYKNQEVALKTVLSYSKRVRNQFKLDMKKQGEAFLAGRSNFKNPFSPTQCTYIFETYDPDEE